MYKTREHHSIPKMCKHNTDDGAPHAGAAKDKDLKTNGYDQIKNKVMESDAEAYNNVMKLAHKKQSNKPRK